MKGKLLLILFSLFTLQISLAQMSVSNSGNIVTFTFNDASDTGEWDANGNPINLYLYINASDTSTSEFTEPAGSWPGTTMTNLGGDMYELVVDLSNYYPEGTTINDIQYIFNWDGNQNPSSGGFSATAAGFTPITTLSSNNVNKETNAVKFVNGQLFGNNKVYSINVYNVFGQLVKNFEHQMLENANGFELGINKNEMFIVQVKSNSFSKVLKVISQ